MEKIIIIILVLSVFSCKEQVKSLSDISPSDIIKTAMIATNLSSGKIYTDLKLEFSDEELIFTYNDLRNRIKDNHSHFLDVTDKKGSLPIVKDDVQSYYELLKKIESNPYKNDNRFEIEIDVHTKQDSFKLKTLDVNLIKETIRFIQGDLLKNEIIILVNQ